MTFYKELTDSCGTLHEVPLRTVYVAGVASEEQAMAAARMIFEGHGGRNRWKGAADGCRVDRGH